MKSPARPGSAILGAFMIFVACLGGRAADPADVRARLRRDFDAARARLDAIPATNAVQRLAAVHEFCRLSYDLATLQSEDSERARITQLGVAAARASLSNNPASAPTHYYLALNLGELARTKTLGALKLLPAIRDSLESARALDESYDHGGPDRTLGLLYHEAPGWPTSLGSRDKAKAHFLKALQIAPEYPGNQLCLAEALLRWRDIDAARDRIRSMDAIWTNAMARFTGPRWEMDWAEWSARRDALKRQLPPPRK